MIGNIGSLSEYKNISYSKFDFYSGSQITIWFGNILIDDVNTIQWNRIQNKRPIYGYASQTFDVMAKGTVLIQGVFAINFRQKGYIPAIMEEIRGLYGNINNKAYWPEVKRLVGLHLKNGTFGPQTSQEIQNIGNSENFFELAKAYENTIWGGGTPEDEGKDDLNADRAAADVFQSEEIPRGFDILITYGNTSGAEARTLNDQLQSTTKALNGVHITGESQMIEVGGQPIQEQYSFIANDTDRYMGSTR